MIPRIDKQVQQAQLSAGSNPQQLAEKYKKSRKLVDLLAMQKMKSEKEAAAKEMQMQMDTQPKTIIAQREAELLGQTQQEVMAKIAPGMKQAGVASIPQQGQPQQGQPPQGQPPQGGFAAGGIVSYGGQYSGEDGQHVVEDPNAAENIEATMLKQIMFMKQAGKTEDEIRQSIPTNNPTANKIIAAVFHGDTPAASEGIAAALPQAEETPKKPSLGEFNRALYSNALYDDPEKSRTTSIPQDIGQAIKNIHPLAQENQGMRAVRGIGAALEPYIPAVVEAGGDFAAGVSGADPTQPPPAGMADATRDESIESLMTGDASTVDLAGMADATRDESIGSLMTGDSSSVTTPVDEYALADEEKAHRSALMKGNTEALTVDTAGKGEAARQRTKEGYASADAKMAEREKKRQGLESLMTKSNDPATMKKQAMIARLLGAAGQSTTSGAFAGSGRAGLNIDNHQLQRQKRDAAGIQQLLDSEYKDEVGKAKAVSSAYDTAEQKAETVKAQAVQSGTTLSNATVKALTDRELASFVAEQNRIRLKGQDETKLISALKDNKKVLLDLEKQLQADLSMDADYRKAKRALQEALEDADGAWFSDGKEEIANARKRLKQIESNILQGAGGNRGKYRDELIRIGREIEKKLGYKMTTIGDTPDLSKFERV